MTHGPVAIVGLGLIGGSLARALHERGVAVRGWSIAPEDRELAARAGIPVADEPDAMVSDASAVVFAVPIDRLAGAADAVLGARSGEIVALHAGGLQGQHALALDDRQYARIIGTHPLAGSHESGFAASRADLFAGATVSVEARAGALARASAEWVWCAAGATRIDYRPAEEHDRLMTWVSHLPQLASTALAATLARHGVDLRALGPGGRDTTRLAASPFSQWGPLLAAAPRDLSEALHSLEDHLARLCAAIERHDRGVLAELWSAGEAWRRGAAREADDHPEDRT